MARRTMVARWMVLALVIGWLAPMTAWADDATALIAAHREAVAAARAKVAYHEEMGKQGSIGKFDVAAHCRFWADYYRRVAAQEEQAVKELE